MSSPLEDVMNSLADSFDRDTPSEITYKDFMSANKDSSLYDIFNTYDMASSEPYMVICKIIKQKYGIKHMTDELFWFIREFPVHIDKLSKEIQAKEGMVCCVDKAWSRSLKYLNELIEINVNKEKSA
jgi:hypothetical protein